MWKMPWDSQQERLRSPVQIRATPAQIILFETRSDEQSSILTLLRIWLESILRGQESCQVSEPLLTSEVSRTLPLIHLQKRK